MPQVSACVVTIMLELKSRDYEVETSEMSSQAATTLPAVPSALNKPGQGVPEYGHLYKSV